MIQSNEKNLNLPGRDPLWYSRLFFFLITLIIFFPLLTTVEFYPWKLFEDKSTEITLNFLASFFPPEFSFNFLLMIADETIQTIAIATAGLFLALLIGVPGGLLICTRLSLSNIDESPNSLGSFLRYVCRLLLIILRSVPELVWALIFVRVIGLGPTAGVLAIALTYGGMLGKVYSEILESGDDQYLKNLALNGASRSQILMYALIPQNILELVSYSIYRWECAIRSTVVLGFVGAGGLGQQLENSMKMFNGGEVCTILIMFIFLVFCSDWISKWTRKKLI